MRTKILTIQIFVLFLSAACVMAQKDNSVKDKLNNIKGEVNRIVISTDKGDVTFEGDDAKKIFKNMKTKKIRWISEDVEERDFDGENIFIMRHGDDEDFDIIEGGQTVKVEVEDKNGEKMVTVTTTEDGEEKVETFEGKEAEEYLENMEDDRDMIIDIDSDEDNILVHKIEDTDNIGIDVKIELNDGVKKITETTTENGEKSVKVYEGEEAEKYLKENNEKRIKMKDGKKYKKVIIKEIKEEDEK